MKTSGVVRKSRFLELPLELRDLTYKFYFEGTTFNVSHIIYGWPTWPWPFLRELSHLSLFSVCRSIREEALPAFFRYTCIVISGPYYLVRFHDEMEPRWAKSPVLGDFASTIACLRLHEPISDKIERKPAVRDYTEWVVLGKVIRRCSNLREVQVVLEDQPSRFTSTGEIERLLSVYLNPACMLYHCNKLSTIRIFIEPWKEFDEKVRNKFQNLYVQRQSRLQADVKILPIKYIKYPELWDTPVEKALQELINDTKELILRRKA